MRTCRTGRDPNFGGNTGGNGTVFVRHGDLGEERAGFGICSRADKAHRAFTLFSGDEIHRRRLAAFDLTKRLLWHLQRNCQRPIINDAPDFGTRLNKLTRIK